MPHVSLQDDERSAVVWVIDSLVAPGVAPWFDETWQGAEHVPADRGCVIAANHLSYSDPFVLGRFILRAVGRLPHFLGKAEVFAVPVLGSLLRRAGQIPVYRGSARASESFAAAVDAVEEGKVVCLLPEGTLTRDEAFWPMAGKTGAARIALTTGCPLVPVAMWGPQAVLPPGHERVGPIARALSRRHRVAVSAGPPLDLDDLRGRPLDAAVLAEATERLMAAITALLADLRGEQPPTDRLANPRVASRPSGRSRITSRTSTRTGDRR